MFKYQILRKGGLPLVFIGEPLGGAADDCGEAKLYRTRHGRYVPVVTVLGVTFAEPRDTLEDAMAFIVAHSEVLGKALAAKLAPVVPEGVSNAAVDDGNHQAVGA